MATQISRTEIDPISLADMKVYLRVTHDQENDFIEDLISSGREFVEQVKGEALTEATYEQISDAGLNYFEADIRNAREIVKVEYYDGESWGDVTGLYRIREGSVPTIFELDSAQDELGNSEEEGIFDLFAFLMGGALTQGEYFEIRNGTRNIRITYKAGSASAENLDTFMKNALRMFCGFFYEHRQAEGVPKFLYDFLGVDRKRHVF